MRRRDFVKSAAFTAIGASIIQPLETFASTNGATYLESDELSASASLKNGFPLNFMAIGDWGRNGEYHQSEVAKQMGLWAAKNPNQFVISVGDNFYPRGVISEQDPLWHYSFENVYTAHSLQCNWYAVLGNHDYGADPDAQIRYSKISRRWHMPARYYSSETSLGKDKGKVLFVMIDTDPFLHPTKQEENQKQLQWLNTTLAHASADVKWKIVVGHHPYYSTGPRNEGYDTLTMRNALGATLEKHKVDVYLCGHEHSLQHIKHDGFTHQFITGAGSELTHVTAGMPFSRFEASEHGFMYFSLDTNRINVTAINDTGKILYETALTK